MSKISAFKKKLSFPTISWQICLLAIICGLASALLVSLFLLTIDLVQDFYRSQAYNYISLSGLSRFQMPLMAVLFILIMSEATGYQYVRTGIPFILHRLKVAYGVMPLRNTMHQFFGGAIALGSGFSVGKEGPSVHLGTACASYLADKLKLPHNAIRTLSACGVAAGISACFNTPIAAVIFVMEVILREYKVHIFIPVMLAAIIGSIVTQHIFGDTHEFEYFANLALDFAYYPLLVILGVFLGTLATVFNKYLTATIERFQNWHLVKRLLLATIITGAFSYLIPNNLVNDLTSISHAIEQNWHWQMLFFFLLVKILMTIAALGLGIPGGIIGPILMIGAVAGMCGAAVATYFLPSEHLISDFALLGMAGFLAATLNAPLAALLAVVELCQQLDVVVPAMIVISVACLVSKQVFHNRSIFIMQLDVQNLAYRKPPIEESLQNIGVLAITKNNITQLELADNTLAKATLNDNFSDNFIINQYLDKKDSNKRFEWLRFDEKVLNQEIIIRHSLIPLPYHATLAEAYQLLKEKRQGGVYIYDKTPEDIIGIITFQQISQYLQEGKLN